jgi:ethanolamine ammonia-lyase small subunit
MSDERRTPATTTSVGAPDPWHALERFTPARIALGRAGASLPTRPLLAFQLAHARARDAVLRDLDTGAFAARLAATGFETITLASMAADRATYIARPDLGRRLDDASKHALSQRAGPDTFDCAFVVADGLSASAIEAHALPLLEHAVARMPQADWRLAPMCVVSQGRVAVGDEVGMLLRAAMTVLLVGERPGLSSPDSLGIYLTWNPTPGRTNAERNCISNIRPPQGLSYELAADTLLGLMNEARRRGCSGVALKVDGLAVPIRCPTAS